MLTNQTGLAAIPTWLVVRDHVPVESSRVAEDDLNVSNSEKASDVENGLRATELLDNEDKTSYAIARTSIGRDTA